MKSIKAEVWDRITNETGDFQTFHTLEQTPRLKAYEELFDGLCDKFSKTLSNEQQVAFKALMDMNIGVMNSRQDVGVAMGINIATEMQKILSNPGDALLESCAYYPMISETEKHNIRILEKYFWGQYF